MVQADGTYDPGVRNWAGSANGHPDFPIQNLPFGVFGLACSARSRECRMAGA